MGKTIYPVYFNVENEEASSYPAIKDLIYKTRRRVHSVFPYHDPIGLKRIDNLLLTPTSGPDDDIKTELFQELQANILMHHRKAHVYYYFIRFRTDENNIQATKEWIANFTLNKVSTAYQELTEGYSSIYCLYFTHQGYKHIGVRDKKIPGNESSVFREGLLERAGFKNKGPEDIEAVFQDKDKWHIVVMYASNKELGKGQELEALRFSEKYPLEDVCDLDSIKIQKGGKIPKSDAQEDRFKDEWFGFKDMISQPHFVEDKNNPRRNKVFPLGLVLTPDNGGQNWFSCGSYVALLKIEQDVQAFNEAVDTVAASLALEDKQMAEAYLMGRFKNGTSISVDNKPSSDEKANYNDKFNYTEQVGIVSDQFGSRCPFHAHARRANPRTPDTEDKILARRGIPYDDRPSGGNVGMLFMSLQHSLEDQFEVVLNDWLLSNYINDYPLGQDAIIGDDHSVPLLFPAKWNSERHNNKVPIKIGKNMTKFRGGLYLFAPSISFLLSCSPRAYEKWQNKKAGNRTDEVNKLGKSLVGSIDLKQPANVPQDMKTKRSIPFEKGSVFMLERVNTENIAGSIILSNEPQEMEEKRNAKFIEKKEEKLIFRYKTVV